MALAAAMNFAPPTTGLYPGQEDAPDEAAAPPADDGRPLTAQQRLAALKAKLAGYRASAVDVVGGGGHPGGAERMMLTVEP